MRDRPAAGAFAVETQFGGQRVEATAHQGPAVAEFPAAHQRCDGELPLADQRLGVDDQPRLPRGAQHVVSVQVLVQQYLVRALRVRQRVQHVHGQVVQGPFEGPTGPFVLLCEFLGPRHRLVGQ
ncbi:MAG TPA: hypothetical protein VIS06_10715 [Mycobacteriales bacterium]